MGRRFVISDHHFWHTNIIKYENRPFKDSEHMNREMIKRHNKVVSKRDKVYMLGDIAMANKERIAQVVEQLNGYLILVMGNHDRDKNALWWSSIGFSEVSKNPILVDDVCILSHEPIAVIQRPYWNIHGHLHSKYMTIGDRYYNISVETHDYYPYDLDTLVKKLKKIDKESKYGSLY